MRERSGICAVGVRERERELMSISRWLALEHLRDIDAMIVKESYDDELRTDM
jgi:hypothetical protein